ncbi:unnamed protein product [Spirodela intermedia]|uniref:Uncharacterized protein n=1 Tax=Spirodela intermedia TaxID=51605 RepID=A0A7I8LFW1_SPIIN|nr:unnamed protein product [Spirodela intermedia]
MGRAPCCDKANVKKGPWSPDEDAKLKAYIEEHGTGGNWIALPHKIGLKRCGKSCRLRWLNYLRPNIKHGGFSEEEDKIICSLYISIGSRWSIIAAQLPGRTDNDIKNYWNTRLKKKLLGRRKEPRNRRFPSTAQESKEVADGMSYDAPSQGLSASALERMQLQMKLHGLQHPLAFLNNPALWPKFHPFCGRIPMEDTAVQQAPDTAAMVEPSERVALPNGSQISHSMVGTNLADIEASSLTGLTSPPSSMVLNTEQPEADFGSAVALQAELSSLIYGKIDYLPEIHQAGIFKEMGTMKESGVWCPPDNGFGEKSVLTSWDSASLFQPWNLLQDYVPGYDV